MNPASNRRTHDSGSRPPERADRHSSSARPGSVRDIEHSSPRFHDLCERYRQIDARTQALCIHIDKAYNWQAPMLRGIVAVELEILRRQRDRLLDEIIAAWQGGTYEGASGPGRDDEIGDH